MSNLKVDLSNASVSMEDILEYKEEVKEIDKIQMTKIIF